VLSSYYSQSDLLTSILFQHYAEPRARAHTHTHRTPPYAQNNPLLPVNLCWTGVAIYSRQIHPLQQTNEAWDRGGEREMNNLRKRWEISSPRILVSPWH